MLHHLKILSLLSKSNVSCLNSLTNKHVRAVRTPICKARRGGLKDAYPEDLLSAALKGLLKKTKIDPKLVDDIQVGNVLPPGGGATVARMAMFHAGYL